MKDAWLIPAVCLALLLAGCAQKAAGPQEEMKNASGFRVASSAYADGGSIPEEYTCDGQETSPPVSFSGIPDGARSIALVYDDPDAPGGTYDHWVMWNIPLSGAIEKGSAPPGAVQGVNSGGSNKYAGPCPPSGTHRYIFHAYALDAVLDLPQTAGSAELYKAIQGHVLASSTYEGTYRRE